MAEVLDGPERRRRWSTEEKARIVEESFAADAVGAVVARRYGLHRNQLYAWRREFRRIERASKAGSVPAVAPDGGSAV